MDSIEHEPAPPNFCQRVPLTSIRHANSTGEPHLKHEHIQALTVSELGNIAAKLGVTASSLLAGYEPQPAPSAS